MQFLAHKPLHVWSTGGKTYVYTPACSVLANDNEYHLIATSDEAVTVEIFDTDTVSLYLVMSDDTHLAYVSDHEVEDTVGEEIFPTEEEIEQGLVVSNDLGDGGSIVIDGIHSINMPLATVEGGQVVSWTEVECSYR